jgi:hypothetical protein
VAQVSHETIVLRPMFAGATPSLNSVLDVLQKRLVIPLTTESMRLRKPSANSKG